MKNKLTILFIIIIAVSLIISAVVFVTGADSNEVQDGNVTFVRTPEQDEPEWPSTIPDPREFMVQLPETPNLALDKPVVASSHTDIYIPANAVDGELTSYWESDGFPAEFTINLEGSYTIQTVAVAVNPSSLWEARTQGIEILVSSGDGDFRVIVAEERYEFDPLTGNTVRIDFEPTVAEYVRFVFTSNSASRTQGAQAAEIMVFE
ncbi:MAG: discoidin domain-containing protein [Oscillospiraceae bacterium]|jgi:hypothetical protein|nr:discoidin domain-containing protein [Oscillospiraceae bacterium]